MDGWKRGWMDAAMYGRMDGWQEGWRWVGQADGCVSRFEVEILEPAGAFRRPAIHRE